MRRLSLLGLCFLFAAGCKNPSYQTTLTIEKGTAYQEAEFKGPKSDQELTATVKADEELTVHMISGDDKDEAINALNEKRPPRKVLATAVKTKEATLKAKIAAGKPFVLLFVPHDRDKKVNVELVVK